MSTMDPRTGRAERELKAQGSPGQALLATVFSLFAVLAGACLAYGFVCVFDEFRLMSTNGVFDSWTSPIGNRWPLFLFPGVFGALIFNAAAKRAAVRFGGGYGSVLRVVPFVALGALIVAVLAPELMTAPTTVGVKEDPTFHEPQQWGFAAWALYRLPYVAPVLVGIVFAILLLAGIRSVRRQRLAVDLATQGTRTTGTVVEVRGGSVQVNGMPLITVSVQFTDATGTVRYVTKRKPIPSSQIPTVDQHVLVIYDPANVTDEAKIMLGLGASDAVDAAVAAAGTPGTGSFGAAGPSSQSPGTGIDPQACGTPRPHPFEATGIGAKARGTRPRVPRSPGAGPQAFEWPTR